MKGRHKATRAMLLDEINRLARALETAAALAQDVYSSDDPAGAVDRVIQHARTALGYTTVDGGPLPLGSERPDGEIGRAMTAHVRERRGPIERRTGEHVKESALGSDFEQAGERRHDE